MNTAVIPLFPIEDQKCTKCGILKHISEFNKDNGRKSGLSTFCRTCARKIAQKVRRTNPEKMRAYQRKWGSREENKKKKHETVLRWRLRNPEKYHEQSLKKSTGITVNQYNQMFVDQQGCCAICGIPKSDLSVKLFVDHDHQTGEIRGLLCKQCNFALGNVKDSVVVLKKAIIYLTQRR